MIDVSVLELFRVEVESQVAIINQGLVELEFDMGNPARLEALMRAAHSVKGAARIVKLPVAVTLAHAMEDCFTSLQKGATLPPEGFDLLLRANDRFAEVARVDGYALSAWLDAQTADFEALAQALRALPASAAGVLPPSAVTPAPAPAPSVALPSAESPPPPPVAAAAEDRTLRVNAEYLERIMGLAAEALVESGRLLPLSRGLVQIRRGHEALGRRFDDLVPRLERSAPDEHMPQAIRELRGLLRQASERLLEQEILAGQLEQRLTQLTGDIYDEATLSRMRAFADGIAGLPRMARDLARELGKEVRLEVTGTATQVDRDVLESLQAPLNHLLRNAIDHAIEPPAERVAAGKPPAGSIWVDARHHAGLLRITVRDDGRGIDTQRLRAELVRRKLVTEALGSELSDAELFEFLFLPSFSLTREVTEISGRGVGLDIVLSALQRMRGTIRIHSELGQGASFELQLPLTLSVLRGLVVEVMEQVYVFPLVRVERVLSVATTTLQSLEGREYCEHDGAAIGLVTARQILRFPADPIPRDRLSLVLLGERSARYGVVVDRLRTVAEVVVQPIDPALGKLRNIAAATLLASGEPALILDVDDLIRSIDGLISAGRLSRARPLVAALREQKRILVVDDSFTVREVERKLLENRGYRVDVAVDGMDGWNALRGGAYDLIVTDVDMPRMNGIELVAMIRKDPLLRSLPVMIVSYKDREEDRQRGLAVGADYYLAKSSFQDDSLLDVVKELIGAA